MTDNSDELLPLHRAPFYFAPHYLASVKEWQTSFVELASKCATWPAAVRIPFEGGRQVQITFGAVVFTIDAGNGSFNLDEGMDLDDPRANTEFGIYEAPKDFFSYLDNSAVPDRLAGDVAVIRSIARNIHAAMLGRFHAALATGHAVYEGRVGEIFADLRAIDRNQFLNLNLNERRLELSEDDVELDTAVAADGTRVYSLGVRPKRDRAAVALTAPPSEPAVQSPANGDSAAALVKLIALMRANPAHAPVDPETHRPMAQRKLAKEFTQEFGTTTREFEDLWKTAIKKTGSKWSSRGRRPQKEFTQKK